MAAPATVNSESAATMPLGNREGAADEDLSARRPADDASRECQHRAGCTDAMKSPVGGFRWFGRRVVEPVFDLAS